MNTLGIAQVMPELGQFMNGVDSFTLRRLVGYFSDGGKYLHPRELMEFWTSLSESDKNYYRKLVVTRVI